MWKKLKTDFQFLKNSKFGGVECLRSDVETCENHNNMIDVCETAVALIFSDILDNIAIFGEDSVLE